MSSGSGANPGAESVAYVSAFAAIGVSAAISALLVATHPQRRRKEGARPSLLNDAPGLLGDDWHTHELKIGNGALLLLAWREQAG